MLYVPGSNLLVAVKISILWLQRRRCQTNYFDDRFIYDELEKELENRQIAFVQLLRKDALSVFKRWEEKNDKTKY